MQFQLWDYATTNFLGVTTAAIGVIDCRQFEELAFDITTISTETVNLTSSFDGVNYSTVKLRPINMNTGALAAASDLAAGMYFLSIEAFGFIKFTKSAAVETVNIRAGLGR